MLKYWLFFTFMLFLFFLFLFIGANDIDMFQTIWNWLVYLSYYIEPDYIIRMMCCCAILYFFYFLVLLVLEKEYKKFWSILKIMASLFVFYYVMENNEITLEMKNQLILSVKNFWEAWEYKNFFKIYWFTIFFLFRKINDKNSQIIFQVMLGFSLMMMGGLFSFIGTKKWCEENSFNLEEELQEIQNLLSFQIYGFPLYIYLWIFIFIFNACKKSKKKTNLMIVIILWWIFFCSTCYLYMCSWTMMNISANIITINLCLKTVELLKETNSEGIPKEQFSDLEQALTSYQNNLRDFVKTVQESQFDAFTILDKTIMVFRSLLEVLKKMGELSKLVGEISLKEMDPEFKINNGHKWFIFLSNFYFLSNLVNQISLNNINLNTAYGLSLFSQLFFDNLNFNDSREFQFYWWDEDFFLTLKS